MSQDHTITIHTYADDNRTEVTIRTAAGTLMLEISPDGSVSVPYPERAKKLRRRHKFRLFFGLEDDNLRDWDVSEENDFPDHDVITQFATKKNRRPK